MGDLGCQWECCRRWRTGTGDDLFGRRVPHVADVRKPFGSNAVAPSNGILPIATFVSRHRRAKICTGAAPLGGYIPTAEYTAIVLSTDVVAHSVILAYVCHHACASPASHGNHHIRVPYGLHLPVLCGRLRLIHQHGYRELHSRSTSYEISWRSRIIPKIAAHRRSRLISALYAAFIAIFAVCFTPLTTSRQSFGVYSV